MKNRGQIVCLRGLYGYLFLFDKLDASGLEDMNWNVLVKSIVRALIKVKDTPKFR